ncbi:MAG: T9SS type A sorting domain-containing protein [Bacteroidales bacterium]|nr:T9SS type A sorting domain-containing protein [Bacteroidales bacterium]
MRKYKILQLFFALAILLIHSLSQAQIKNTNLVVEILFDENEYISDLKTVDLNNDDADELIILSNSNYSHIYNFRWYDTYFQEIWTTTIWPSFWVYGMQTADFDNDGKDDLLISWEGMGCSHQLSYYKNYGDVFVDQGYLIESCPDEIFCTHDLNGDSLVDLATGSVFANSQFSIQLYKHNLANQSVQYMGLLPNGTKGSNMVKSLNINNDDKMDILGAEKYSGILYTYLNEGDFNFTQTYTHQFPNRIYSIETTDFNNDGFEDFVAAEFMSKLHFFRNEGDGEFNLIFSSSEDENWNETEATDINHDGKPDLIAQTYDGHIYLFKNLGNFTFEEMIYPESDTVSYDMTLGDFDGNGEVDLVYGRNPAYIVFDALYSFIPVSVQEQPVKKDEGLSITQNVPNPFEDFTTIALDLKQSKTGELTIFDQTGKNIFSYPVDPTMNKIEISGELLKPGIYFYQLKTENGLSETKKMIKIN